MADVLVLSNTGGGTGNGVLPWSPATELITYDSDETLSPSEVCSPSSLQVSLRSNGIVGDASPGVLHVTITQTSGGSGVVAEGSFDMAVLPMVPPMENYAFAWYTVPLAASDMMSPAYEYRISLTVTGTEAASPLVDVETNALGERFRLYGGSVLPSKPANPVPAHLASSIGLGLALLTWESGT